LALQAASSDTSTSTTARIQASYAIVTDFFNGLLGGAKGGKARAAKMTIAERKASALKAIKARWKVSSKVKAG
jgi:hypothetical protein